MAYIFPIYIKYDTRPYTKDNEEQWKFAKELVQDNASCNKCHLDSCSLSWQFLLSFEATFSLLFVAYSTSVPFYDIMLTLKYATLCLMAIDAKFFLLVMHFHVMFLSVILREFFL